MVVLCASTSVAFANNLPAYNIVPIDLDHNLPIIITDIDKMKV